MINPITCDPGCPVGVHATAAQSDACRGYRAFCGSLGVRRRDIERRRESEHAAQLAERFGKSKETHGNQK